MQHIILKLSPETSLFYSSVNRVKIQNPIFFREDVSGIFKTHLIKRFHLNIFLPKEGKPAIKSKLFSALIRDSKHKENCSLEKIGFSHIRKEKVFIHVVVVVRGHNSLPEGEVCRTF